MPDPLAWQSRAKCAEIGGDLWFPEMGGTTIHVKRICASCPVAQQCLDYALAQPPEEDRDGVFGGKSVKERREIRRRMREVAA